MGFKESLLSHKVIVAVLFLLTFAVFANTFQNDWTYDDIPVVLDNPDIRSLENFLQNTYDVRPLRELSYMLDYTLFGTDPAGYHVQQLLWHAANGCLLFLLMSCLGLPPLYGFLGSCLFLFHPVQVESVASIGHRKELLPLFFGVLMLLIYIKSLSTFGLKRLLLWGSCLGCYGLVLAGNVTAGTFPLLLPLFEWLFVDPKDRVILKRPLVFWLTLSAVVAACGYYYVQHFNFERLLLAMYAQNGFAGTQSYLPLLLMAFKVPVLYLGKFFWPLNLAPEYVVDFSQNWLQWQSLAGVFMLVLLVSLVWSCRNRWPALSFALGWCLVLYLPVSNLLPVHAHPMADRYLYMILPGAGMALAVVLHTLQKRWVNFSLALVLVACAGLTIVQNTHWRNNAALWQHAVQVSPESKAALWSYSQVLLKQNEYAEAKSLLNKVLDIDRFYVHAYLELAKIFEREGNLSEAKKHYELFVRYGQFIAPDEAMRVRNYLRIRFP